MGGKAIFLDPVTRVEGSSRVIIQVDEEGGVSSVAYQILELRGFEAFCRGRAVEEMPRLTSAVCGVCSWSHHLASGKAVDGLLGRDPPEAALFLRQIANYVQIVDSHLLHLGIMALPDYVLSNEPPELRNIAGLVEREPRVAKMILESRRTVEMMEEILGGKPVHSAFVAPGGISRRPTEADLERFGRLAGDLKEQVMFLAEFFNRRVAGSDIFRELLSDPSYSLRSLYIGLVGPSGELEFYDGDVRIVDGDGREVAKFKPWDYADHIAEYCSGSSYSKFPYPRKLGWGGYREELLFRTGPLARLNVASKVDTEMAGEEHGRMLDSLGHKPIHATVAYHWARIVECLYCVEKIHELLADCAELIRGDVASAEGEFRGEGVGVVEAPRGTLIHHYRADEDLVTTDVNIITPTAINNAAMNAELGKVVASFWRGGGLTDELAERIEMSIRAYDPCNSCATHSLEIVVTGRQGGPDG